MDIQLLCTKTEEYHIKAAKRYSNELESKGILALIAAATEFHDMIVPEGQKIGLQTNSGIKHNSTALKDMFLYNWDKLNVHYNDTNLQNQHYIPKSIKEFLIKWWWMGYNQYAQHSLLGALSTHSFNWNRIIFELQQLSKTL